MVAFQRIAEERLLADRLDRLQIAALGSQGSGKAIKTEIEKMRKELR